MGNITEETEFPGKFENFILHLVHSAAQIVASELAEVPL